MKKIILLGATGSIGTQTIDVVKHHVEDFQIVAMSCGRNISLLKELLKSVDVKHICVQTQEDFEILQAEYKDITFYYGNNGLLEMLSLEADVVVNALVGFVGLRPSLKAIETGKVLALANKESLVVGGMIVKQYLDKYHGTMYPIDSEHSAIFQALQGNKKGAVKNLVVTASGGSFRDKTRDELVNVSVSDALNHPNWSMGTRITIDSATMMNKGFEVIEAHYLFDVDFDHIQVLMNKESIIHSMVQYVDNSFIAQLGTADMRLPIQYALTYPERITLYGEKELDLAEIGTLHFGKVDFERYPLLKLAYDAGRKKGNTGAIINAADESCIDLFVKEKISFLDIEKYIFMAYENIPFIENPTLEELEETDAKTRAYVYALVENR